MPPKRQLAYLKWASEVAKKKREEKKNSPREIEEPAPLFLEDESTEGSWQPEKEEKNHLHSDLKDEESEEEEDDIEMTDDDEDTLDEDAFAKLLGVARDFRNFETHKIAYIRGPSYTKQWERKRAQHRRELAASAQGCQPLEARFLIQKTVQSTVPIEQSPLRSFDVSQAAKIHITKYISPKDRLHSQRLDAIRELEKKIASRKTNLQGQDLARHRAVLSFLRVQIRKSDCTRKEIAQQVAECFGRGSYVAQKIVT